MTVKSLKAFIQTELISMGILENGSRIDVDLTYSDYGLTESELDELVSSIEDEFGIVFDEEFTLDTIIKDSLNFSHDE